ncbi:MAG: TadE/TadG family type IV pilus assembly protein [Aeromicrobium sp.]|uniref:TadE/TadG family type IV pilus assembly protein n=1 Tax=Aeromicrobium sp. TaxID=1871063 RepID=UPI0039E33D50
MVDFVLVTVVLVPLVLGVMQVALVMHVRNVSTAAASEGARAAAALDAPAGIAERRTREQIEAGVGDRFTRSVSVVAATVAGTPGVEVRVVSEVPALGLFGPGMTVEVSGHAVREVEP